LAALPAESWARSSSRPPREMVRYEPKKSPSATGPSSHRTVSRPPTACGSGAWSPDRPRLGRPHPPSESRSVRPERTRRLHGGLRRPSRAARGRPPPDEAGETGTLAEAHRLARGARRGSNRVGSSAIRVAGADRDLPKVVSADDLPRRARDGRITIGAGNGSISSAAPIDVRNGGSNGSVARADNRSAAISPTAWRRRSRSRGQDPRVSRWKDAPSRADPWGA